MNKPYQSIFKGAFFFIAISTWAGASPASGKHDRPNIIWISAEDTGLEYGCYGDRYAKTPTIDKLAAGGLKFTNCFAEAPMCAPSRFALITGMHTGPMGTTPMRSAHPIPDQIGGFPRYLRAAGYFCTNNEKTDYNTSAAERIVGESWDESGGWAHWRHRQPGQPFFAVFNFMDTHQSRASQMPYGEFQKRVQSRLSKEKIHDFESAPLPPFLPETELSRRTVARYYDCISALDDFVQKLLSELENDGLREDTIIVFFADNGAGLPRSKAAAYESGVREPLIVWAPPKYLHLVNLAAGATDTRLVTFVDFGPTMLALAGIEIPQYMAGQPFLGAERRPARTYVVGTRDRMDETLEITRWVNDGRFHYIRNYITDVPADQQTTSSFYNRGGQKVITPQGSHWELAADGGELCRDIRSLIKAGSLTEIQKRFWANDRAAEELYDGVYDPWNLNNLANRPEFQGQLHKMREYLRSWIIEENDLGFMPECDRVTQEGAKNIKEEYPIREILSAAELASSGTTALSALRNQRTNQNGTIRYWAVVGLRRLHLNGLDLSEELRESLSDSMPSVRIEAARALVERKPNNEAIRILLSELSSDNEWASATAARALELLGKRVTSYADVIEKALKQRAVLNVSLEFSIRSLLQDLQEESGKLSLR